MRITQFFGTNSKNANYMRYDFEHAHGTVYSRYERPSQAKIQAWVDILEAYQSNAGVHEVTIKDIKHNIEYRNDLCVVGASSHFFSTIASFEDLDTRVIYLVKETHANTYMCEL